jgi:hypothetical protein
MIQTIFDELASETKPYFIAMSQYLNGDAKGKFFPAAPADFIQSFVNDPTYDMTKNPNSWVWPSNGGSTTRPWSAQDALIDMISTFEWVLHGVLEMKSSNMLDLIDRTNNGIYSQL